jgi:UDP-N-acetylglucosamine:LPS N-acetylglucosamine transferase
MAHILLGWELGGNRGHATTLLAIARALRERGHRVSYALQRMDCLSSEGEQAEVWQAPLTPRLLLNTVKPRTAAPGTMGDILARLGFDDPALIASVIAGWDRLLGAIRPDLVIAEYAPFLLTAARARVPSVSVGTAFSAPPAELDQFPSFGGASVALSEADSLAAVNEALRRCGRGPLDAFPRVFAADRVLAGGFAELDPYRSWRRDPLVRPATGGDVPIALQGGTEVFVYAPEQVQVTAPIWSGLAASGLPVRVHVSSVGDDYRRQLTGMGLTVEERPLSFAEIGRRARLLVSHGGHGFVCSALLAGLPQVICHFDLEKFVYAKAVTDLGLGGMVSLLQIEPEPFAQSLVEVYGNDDLAGRARAAAPAFQARHDRPMEASVADAVEQLL